MSDPGNMAGLVDEVRTWDPVLPGRFHPVLGDGIISFHAHRVVHLVALILDELGDFFLNVVTAFPDGDAHDLDLALVLFLQLGQVGDSSNARSAPCCPTLDDVGVSGFEGIDTVALDPGDLVDGRSLVADHQGLLLLGFFSLIYDDEILGRCNAGTERECGQQ